MTAPARRAVIGLDVGTTSAKAVAYTPDGVARGAGEHAYELCEPAPGHAEQDPATMLDAAVAAVRDAAAAVEVEIAGIAVSTAMHGLVGLDAGGAPLGPLLTWADTRATAEAEWLQTEHPGLQARTGTPPHPMAPLPKLRWLAAHEPDRFARAAHWVGLKELVLRRLTGRLCLDHSVASGTGLFALATLDWDPEALALAGVGAEQLAELVPATEEVGGLTADAAEATGLPAGLPVIAGAADGPLANLGVGAVHPGVAACSIGTSGALRLMVERPAVDRRGRVFCYALTPGRWVVGGAINNGGSVLQWAGEALAPDLGEGSEAALTELAARAPAGSDGLVMLPYLHAERAPHWSALPRGAYVGLTQAHRREHLVRAALEGVCQQLALVLSSLRDAGNEVRAVRATGGFARSPLWRQLLADALGLDVEFPRGHEGSAFGAALLGMQALGLIDSIDRATDLVRIEHVVRPDAAAAATYAAALPLFARLADDLAPAFTAMRALDD